jgi:uncharacterized membrane protein YfcA
LSNGFSFAWIEKPSGISRHTEVGTASTLIPGTAFMGFSRHAIQRAFNPSWAVLLAIITVFGGILGRKLCLRTRSKQCKSLFSYTNWLTALFMIINVIPSRGIIEI